MFATFDDWLLQIDWIMHETTQTPKVNGTIKTETTRMLGESMLSPIIMTYHFDLIEFIVWVVVASVRVFEFKAKVIKKQKKLLSKIVDAFSF